MNYWWKNRLFKRVTIYYVVLFSIVILATAEYAYRKSAERLENEVIYTNIALLNQVNDNIDMRLKNIDKLILNFLQDMTLSDFMRSKFNSSYERMMTYDHLQTKINALRHVNEDIFSIYVYSDIEKIVLTSENSMSVEKFFDNEWLDYYRNLDTHYGWMSTRSYLSKGALEDHQKNVVTFIRPYPISTDKNIRTGAIIVIIDEDVLYNTIKKIKSERLDDIFILDSNGQIISHSNKDELYKNLSDRNYGKYILSHDAGSVKMNVEGANSAVFYVTAPYTGWKYVNIMSAKSLRNPMNSVRTGVTWVTLAILFIAVLSTLVISHWSYRPINDLVDSIVRRIKKENREDREDTDWSDINKLEEMFENMFINNEKMRVQINKSLPAIKWRLIMEILMGNDSRYYDVSPHLERVGASLYSSNYVVIAIDIDSYGEYGVDNADNVKKMSLYSSSICEKAEELLNNEYKGLAIAYHESQVVVIMSFGDENYEKGIVNAFAVSELLRDFVNRYLGITITLGVGSLVYKMEEISKSFKEALEALKYKVVMGKGSVIYIEDVTVQRENKMYQMSDFIDAIIESYTKVDYDGVMSNISLLCEEIVQVKITNDLVRQICMQLIMQAVKVLQQRGIETENIMVEENMSIYEMLNGFGDMEQIEEFLENVFSVFLSKIETKRNIKASDELIDKVVEYIHNNYMDYDLSLNKIAVIFHVSVPYLSKIFKESVNQKFLDYLIGLRIEKSKEILKDGEIKLNEVADKVGYPTYTSFIRIFKQYVGMTPTEYRKQHIL